jgi:hypothetical protein
MTPQTCSWHRRRFSQPVQPWLETRETRKQQHGLDGTIRGREAAGLDAAGAAIGRYCPHGIGCRRLAAYASSVDVAGDDLRHARLAHNLRRDLLSAEDARTS